MTEQLKETLKKEKELWNKIEKLREEMIKKANEKELDFLHPEVLDLSQNLNRLLVEYEKLLHTKK